MAQFAREHKDQINSDPLFRDRFSEMCQQYDVNPMSGISNIKQLRKVFGVNLVLETSINNWRW